MNGGYEMQNFAEGIIDFVWIIKKLDEIKIFYTDFLSLFQ